MFDGSPWPRVHLTAQEKQNNFTIHEFNSRFTKNSLKEAGIIERYGSGIKPILERFSMYGLGQPLFEDLQEEFRVTILRTTQKISTKEHILQLLKENPSLISV